MATLAATTTLNLTGRYSKSRDLTVPSEPFGFTIPDGGQKYTNGTGANQANTFFSDKRTLAGAPETIDLTVDLADAFGTTLVFTKIKEIIILNTNPGTGEILTISGDALGDMLGGTTPTIKAGPGGVARLTSPVDGFAIAAPSKHDLTVDPGTDTITYWLIIIGTV